MDLVDGELRGESKYDFNPETRPPTLSLKFNDPPSSITVIGKRFETIKSLMHYSPPNQSSKPVRLVVMSHCRSISFTPPSVIAGLVFDFCRYRHLTNMNLSVDVGRMIRPSGPQYRIAEVKRSLWCLYIGHNRNHVNQFVSLNLQII